MSKPINQITLSDTQNKHWNLFRKIKKAFFIYLTHTIVPHVTRFRSVPQDLCGDVVEEIGWNLDQIMKKLELAKNALPFLTMIAWEKTVNLLSIEAL